MLCYHNGSSASNLTWKNPGKRKRGTAETTETETKFETKKDLDMVRGVGPPPCFTGKIMF